MVRWTDWSNWISYLQNGFCWVCFHFIKIGIGFEGWGAAESSDTD